MPSRWSECVPSLQWPHAGPRHNRLTNNCWASLVALGATGTEQDCLHFELIDLAPTVRWHTSLAFLLAYPLLALTLLLSSQLIDILIDWAPNLLKIQSTTAIGDQLLLTARSVDGCSCSFPMAVSCRMWADTQYTVGRLSRPISFN